jgi:hypothetical protein
MYKIAIVLSVLVFIGGCGQTGQPETRKEGDREIIDSLLSGRIMNISNSLFSIPSPHQISIVLIEQNIDYTPTLLNATQNTRNYGNSYKKALNLGVYGADLGYINLYDRTQEAITYFSVIKTLSQELSIINAFRKETFERIEKNLTNQDSLLFLLSNSYQDIDIFLKSNNQEHIGALILAGGWIESMYMLSQFALKHKNQDLISRLGENRKPLGNLIKILSIYTENNRIYQTLVEKLIVLEMIYQEIEITYAYDKTEVIPEKKITKIHSKTLVNIPDEILDRLAKEIESIRQFVIL